MTIQVQVNFHQEGVFYCNEKLRVSFKFINCIQKEDIIPIEEKGYRGNGNEILKSRLRKNSSLSEYNVDDIKSAPSSRSSTESYNRFGSMGFKPNRSNSSTSYYQGEGMEGDEVNKKDMESNHQSTQSMPHFRNSEEVTNIHSQLRNFRPSSVSSWFSSFSTLGADNKSLNANNTPIAKKEKLLWGFAQLVGHFVLDENLVQTNAFEPLKEKRMYRAANGVGHGGSLGGGTFGYNASTFINGNSKNSTMADLKRQGESKLFPVYSTPPSVLFCDITLEPGESVIYDYEIQLPENLPPSYRGKSARFLYYLILGTQQGEITLEPNVVQLPFRLFNTKNEYGESSIYNLLRPELIYSDDAIVKNNQDKIKIKKYQANVNTNIEEFINNGLKSLNLDDEEEDLDLENELQFNMLDIESQCLKAVHQLTRRTKPINYTISKDDTIIGKLYLKKPYYRIGDSVNTIIQFVPSPVKCYQVSITLESFEALKEGYSHHPKHRTDQMTRQILTHQQCLLINTDRIAIDLTIPTTCTPNFETTVVELGYRLRIEFMVGERNEQNILSTSIDRFRTLNKIQNGNTNLLEKLTCLVPIQLLPTNPNYAKLYRSSHSFQLERNFLP